MGETYLSNKRVRYHFLSQKTSSNSYGCRFIHRLKMASKLVLLFLLIAGVFAVESEDDLEFDEDLAESEDYDEVEEEDGEEERDVDIDDRDLEDDMHMLDSGSISEVKAFCADPANAGDPVCQVKM